MDTFIKNKIIINDESDEENWSENDFKNENDDLDLNDYFNDTLNIIKKELIEYIENKDQTLCEYLTIEKLEKFILPFIE